MLRGSEDFALSYCSLFTAELILNVGVILFHQSNRTPESWAGVAAQLAAAGITVLTIDSRGHGESGGTQGGGKSCVRVCNLNQRSQRSNFEALVQACEELGVEHEARTGHKAVQHVKIRRAARR